MQITFQNHKTSNYGNGNRDVWEVAVNGVVVGIACHARKAFAKWAFLGGNIHDQFTSKTALVDALSNGLVG